MIEINDNDSGAWGSGVLKGVKVTYKPGRYKAHVTRVSYSEVELELTTDKELEEWQLKGMFEDVAGDKEFPSSYESEYETQEIKEVE